MAETKIVVSLETKEIRDALVETARKCLAKDQQVGSCKVEMNGVAGTEERPLNGISAKVTFSYSKH